MKKLLIASSLILSSILIFSFTENHEGKKSRVAFYFNKETGFSELVMIKRECERLGIVINYKKIEYNEAGQLKSIAFNVDCGDGFSGGASSDKVLEDKKPGFYRDYNDPESHFGTVGY